MKPVIFYSYICMVCISYKLEIKRYRNTRVEVRLNTHAIYQFVVISEFSNFKHLYMIVSIDNDHNHIR